MSINLSETEMSKGIVLGAGEKLADGMDTTNMGSSFMWYKRLFILNNNKIEWGEYTKKGDIPFENLKYRIDNTIIKLYDSNNTLKLVIRFDNDEDLNYFRILLAKKKVIKQMSFEEGGKRSKKHRKQSKKRSKKRSKKQSKKRRTKKYLR